MAAFDDPGRLGDATRVRPGLLGVINELGECMFHHFDAEYIRAHVSSDHWATLSETAVIVGDLSRFLWEVDRSSPISFEYVRQQFVEAPEPVSFEWETDIDLGDGKHCYVGCMVTVDTFVPRLVEVEVINLRLALDEDAIGSDSYGETLATLTRDQMGEFAEVADFLARKEAKRQSAMLFDTAAGIEDF